LFHSPAGQSVTWSTAKRSVAEIVDALCAQTDEALDRVGRLGR
jgi:hypothetical protein